MSEASSGSGLCGSCGHSLPFPIPKFCGNCGVPQRKYKNCVKCKEQLIEDAKFCVHCGHNQQEPVSSDKRACIKCGNDIPHSVSFCGDCGHNQSLTVTTPRQTTQLVDCLLCGTPSLSSTALPNCLVCHAPANLTQETVTSLQLKQCPLCRTALMPSAQGCYKCHSNQLLQQSLSPQSNTGASSLQPLFSLPSMIMPQMKHCINFSNCKTVLTEPSDVCHTCNYQQPLPTRQELLVNLSPSTSYQTSPVQTSQFPKIAARFSSTSPGNPSQLPSFPTKQGIKFIFFRYYCVQDSINNHTQLHVRVASLGSLAMHVIMFSTLMQACNYTLLIYP